MPVATKNVAEEKDKPVFDEQTLAKLLEAAYVLQEHNRQQKAEPNLEFPAEPQWGQEPANSLESGPSAEGAVADLEDDYTATLAKIIEVQHEIQVRHLA